MWTWRAPFNKQGEQYVLDMKNGFSHLKQLSNIYFAPATSLSTINLWKYNHYKSIAFKTSRKT